MISSLPLTLRCPDKNLVYVGNFKVASSYFLYWLEKHGWKNIQISDIDWHMDHVFSHIMDPIVRRHKGVAEFLDMFGLSDKLINDKSLLQFLQAPYLDCHSCPMSIMFKNKVDAIDWIPIDVESIDYYSLTERLLKKHDVEIKFDHEKIHQSSQKKLHWYGIVEHHYKDNLQYSDLISCTFSEDVALYNNVLYNINSNGSNWDDVSWINNKLKKEQLS
jgi:hypothetical protein